MKKRPLVALVAAGKITGSPVTRFWGLTHQLGPVKAPSLRLASRIVNTLRAGSAVESYQDLAHCSLILICVPDELVSATVADLAASGLSWHNRAVVLCSTWLDSSALTRLAASGASVGSITEIPGFNNSRFLVEGNRQVVRESQRLLKHRGAKILAVEPPLKPFFLAAVTCTGTLLYSLLLASAECLRQSTIPPADRAAIIERQVEKTLRSYFVAGKKAYPEPKELSRQLEALALVQPVVAEYVEQNVKLSATLIAGIK